MRNTLATRQEYKAARLAARRNAAKIWREGIPVESRSARPLHRYLSERSLPVNKAVDFLRGDFKFHRALPYYEKGVEQDRYPALLAIARNRDGQGVFVHRTYLAPNGHGKAPVSIPRKATPYFRHHDSVAIRLGDDCSGQLDVAEGIETALSVSIALRRPVWSTVNTTHMALWTPPQGVRHVTIWADKDVSEGGETAAKTLLDSLTDKQIDARIRLPECEIPRRKKSVDWNDILQVYGENGIFGMFFGG